MFLGYIKVLLFIPNSKSLKDKRQIIARLKQRLQNNFNIAVAERPSDKWQSCEVSFACVDYSKVQINSLIDKIENFIRCSNDFHIVEIEKEII